MKRMFVTLAVVATAAWLFVIPAAAQGRPGGHPGGGGMGAAGSMGDTHGMSGNAGNSAHGMAGSHASGPKTPGDLLANNTQLATKLSGLLPTGTDLQTAADGFKNLGQFVAAVHVSHNLGIPFDQLKCTELAKAEYCPTGMTVPSKGSSLGQSIHTLKPTLTSSDTKSAVKLANKQAKGDIRSSQS